MAIKSANLNSLLSKPLACLGLSLIFACSGQAFLIQRGHIGTVFLGTVFFLVAVLFFIRAQGAGPKTDRFFIAPWLEILLFALILVEAALFRFVRLEQMPAGLNSDTAGIGWWALRILHGHIFPWARDPRAYFVYPAPNYEMALWFDFFPPTRLSIFSFGSFMSLLSFPFIYWYFRQLAGLSTALLTIAFLAPMRWDITLARMAHPAADIHFWMFGCLAFGYWALRSQVKWGWIASSLFLLGGFYAYDSFKPLLLFIVIVLGIEIFPKKRDFSKSATTLWICFFLFSILSIPMWLSLIRGGGFGNPEDHLSAWEAARQSGNWFTFLENPIRTALMFNHQGGQWCLHNLPGHRMLGDVTGLWWVLGLGLGIWFVQERKYLYGLLGLVLTALPGTLTINPEHAARAFGTVPFVCFFAATAVVAAGRILADAPNSLLRGSRWLFLVGMLGLAAFQNGKQYFVDLSHSPDFDWDSGIQQTVIGESIARDDGKNDYYLASRYQGNPTIFFLNYFKKINLRPLPWPGGSWPPVPPNGRGAWFFLDIAQSGLLEMLEKIYPHGMLQTYRRDGGNTGVYGVYLLKVPSADLENGRETALKIRESGQGLRAVYRSKGGAVSQVDPVLNFAYRTDFPVQEFPPLKVEWKGQLKIEKPGIYSFILLSTGKGSLKLGGRTLLPEANAESVGVELAKKKFPLEVIFEDKKDYNATFHLFWKMPGTEKWEVVPWNALGIHG